MANYVRLWLDGNILNREELEEDLAIIEDLGPDARSRVIGFKGGLVISISRCVGVIRPTCGALECFCLREDEGIFIKRMRDTMIQRYNARITAQNKVVAELEEQLKELKYGLKIVAIKPYIEDKDNKDNNDNKEDNDGEVNSGSQENG